MSQWRGRIENIEEPGDILDIAGRYYHIPVVVGLLAFMLWSRIRKWHRFVIDGTVYFSGNDPWYHYRMTRYTTLHFPSTSPFDTYTHFHYGTHSSQFGTVMDQIVATIALIVGLGNPSDHTVRMVSLFAPALFGTATAIPIYVIGRRTSNRFAGVIAVGVLALAASEFVRRSTVGFYDHHIAEAFFMTFAVLGTMVAVSVAEEEKPVWELFEARDLDAVRRPVGWAIAAGIAMAFYVWTWPPGVFLVGIVGVYYVIELSSEYANGESPEHVAIVGAISMGTTGLLVLASLEQFALSATALTLLQAGMAFGVAAGCVFMAWLARQWDARDLSRFQYPVAIAGIIAVGAGLFAVVLPGQFGYLLNQVLRVIGLDVSPTAATIAEAQPLPFEQLYPRYKFTIYIALLGVGYVAAMHFIRKPRAELTLIALWVVFTLLATLTQRRFDYYLVLAVASMTALVVGQFADFAKLYEVETDIETYQLLTILAIVLVVIAPLVYPTVLVMEETNTGPGRSPQAWDQSLTWMQGNTPEVGNFDDAGNDLAYYGTFERTENYDYPEGAYGVLSWWDYGHWITTMGHRIPNANPFQQGANQAANFLLAPNESQANDVLARMSEGENTETRYVMVDWMMVDTESFYRTGSGLQRLPAKYSAPFQFYTDRNISFNDYAPGLYYRSGSGYQFFRRHTQEYYNTTAVRLYRFHGSAVRPSPVVLDWEYRTTSRGGRIPVSNGTRGFRSMEAARNYVENDSTAQIGGYGQYPQEYVPALQHYRLVQASDTSAAQSAGYLLSVNKYASAINPSAASGGYNRMLVARYLATGLQNRPYWVKTFEHVPGATIDGEGPPNATVVATVEMRIPVGNRSSTFTYTQRAQTDQQGEFTMTLPYSTTGYENWGPENGHTNVSVRATGPYEFESVNDGNRSVVYNATVDVSEERVIGEEDAAREVTLERHVIAPPDEEGTDNQSGDTTPDGDQPSTDEGTTDGNTTDTGTDTSTDTGTDTSTDTGTDTSTDTGTDTGTPAGDVGQSPDVDPATVIPLAGVGLVGLVAAARHRRT